MRGVASVRRAPTAASRGAGGFRCKLGQRVQRSQKAPVIAAGLGFASRGWLALAEDVRRRGGGGVSQARRGDAVKVFARAGGLDKGDGSTRLAGRAVQFLNKPNNPINDPAPLAGIDTLFIRTGV